MRRRGLWIAASGAAALSLGAMQSPAAHAADAWWAADKARHYQVSAGLAAGTYIAIRPIADRPERRALLAFSLAVSAGAAKELWDAAGDGVPSLKDMAWNAAGALTGALLAWLLDVGVSDVRVAGVTAMTSSPPWPMRANHRHALWSRTKERDEEHALAASFALLSRYRLANATMLAATTLGD
jgi:uncharacterized protein YfiM (DUF2279 family)